MSVLCYPQPGKARSREVLEAFAIGAGGTVNNVAPDGVSLRSVPAAFYGVIGMENYVHRARRLGIDWYYGDNAFFDRARGRYFRFAKNEFQLSRQVFGNAERLKALGVEVKPWRRDGTHIVVVEQSEHFLRLVGADKWLERTLWELKGATERPLRIRAWRRDKDKASRTLQADLQDAWALVTHMSAAAVESLIAGVPVFVTGACAATPLASGAIAGIERPFYPDGREAWAAGLASMQWTLEELRNGMAWRALNP